MPDGSLKHLHLVAHASRAKEQQLEYIGAIQDITAGRLSEEALGKARADLAHVARVTSLGALAASIAHEVNQPLAAVVTNANACLRFLNRATPDLDEARDAIRSIIRDGHRGSEVIERIRALVKKEQPSRTRVDINETVGNMVRLAPFGSHGADLQMELMEQLPCVLADRVQVQQVLLNLMVNAIDAMKTISDRPRILRVGTKRHDGNTVLVSVQDSGIGIEPNAMEQLFDTFYTTKRDGMGMGLSISQSIIESHGGRLWANCNDGPGATFYFTLPVETGAVT
jgi:C4-dicarboxylate-specific signal transduction histidine kinase